MSATEIMQHGVMWLNHSGQILGVNTWFARELGYSKEKFTPSTIFEVNPHTSYMSWKKTWIELLDKKQISLETEQITVDETIYPVKMRGILMEIDGEAICCGIVENLSPPNRYEDLLNITSKISKIGSWEWDLEQNDILFTDQMYKLLEISKSENIDYENLKLLLQERLKDNEWNLAQNQLIGSVKSGQSFEQELSLKSPKTNGFVRMNLTVHPIRNKEKTLKLYGTLQDMSNISGRTEDMYLTQYSIDHAHEIIFWTDKNGQFIYANNKATQVLGYSKNEFLNLKVVDIDTRVNDEKWQMIWSQLLKERRFESESTHLTANGITVPVQINATLLDYQNQLICCVFVHDLSRKKQRDQQLQVFGVTADTASDMVFWVDESANILFANKTASNELGYSVEELTRGDVFRFVASYEKEDWANRWKKLKEKKSGIFEGLHRRKNKSVFPVEVSATFCTHEDQEIICVYARNITERKQKESRLEIALEKIQRLKDEVETENIILKEEIQVENSFSNIISKSKNYGKVLEQVSQVADTDATVLILGETGTGKELLARAIHQLSDREDRAMVKINCGALPANLIESELFGHEKGAFTGAYQQKKGKFEIADKGTIFLDEMGELPLDLQVQLLRVLQEGEFERIGGNETIKVDVRVIAATNRNLEERVAQGKFREDLFYRLNVFPIINIPLRERMDDVPLLVKHFVNRFSEKMNKRIDEIPPGLMGKLMTYDFPGNIRELENMIERAVILSKGNSLKLDSMIFKERDTKNSGRFKTLEEIQRDHILEALRRTSGKVSGIGGAANMLKINDKTLVSRMKKLGVEKEDYL
jgi:PAS domain S-box-containing protein